MTEIFNFLLSQENFLQACNEINILDVCKTFHDKLEDIDSCEMKEELELFVHVINENTESLKQQEIFLIISAKTFIGSLPEFVHCFTSGNDMPHFRCQCRKKF